MFTITDVRNFFGKRMTWIMMFMAVVMLISMGLMFGGRSRMGLTPDRPETNVFAVINGQAIPRYEFDNDVRQMEERDAQQGQRLSADTRLRAHATAIQALVARVVQEQEAKKRGIDPDDDMVLKMSQSVFEAQLSQERDNLIAQKKLAPNATTREFNDVVRKESGKNVDNMRRQYEDGIKKQLEDPAVKPDLYREAQFWALKEQLKRDIRATAADYERSLETVTLSKVFVSSAKHQNAKARIDEAEKQIKQGVPFDQVAEQLGDYQTDLPANTKNMPKKSYGGSQPRNAMEIDPTFKVIADRPLGYVSPIQKTSDGYVIYKVDAVKKGELPTDYATNRDKYVKQYRDNKADQFYSTWLNEHMAAARVEIKSKPWALLYQWQANQMRAALSGAMPSLIDQEKEAIGVMKDADMLVKARKDDWTEALLLELALSNQIAMNGKDIKAKADAAAIQKKAIEQSAMVIDDPAVWLQAAGQYVQEQQYPKAIKQLIRVSQSAYSERNQQDQDTHWKVQTMLTLIQSKGYAGKDLDEALAREVKYQARAHAVAVKDQELRDKQLAAQRAADAKRKLDEQKKKETAGAGSSKTGSTGAKTDASTTTPAGTPGKTQGK